MAFSALNTIRAWTDPGYVSSLSAADQARLPARPAGLVELDDSELDQRGAFDPLMMPDPEEDDYVDDLPQDESYDDMAGGVPFEDDPPVSDEGAGL